MMHDALSSYLSFSNQFGKVGRVIEDERGREAVAGKSEEGYWRPE